MHGHNDLRAAAVRFMPPLERGYPFVVICFSDLAPVSLQSRTSSRKPAAICTSLMLFAVTVTRAHVQKRLMIEALMQPLELCWAPESRNARAKAPRDRRHQMPGTLSCPRAGYVKLPVCRYLHLPNVNSPWGCSCARAKAPMIQTIDATKRGERPRAELYDTTLGRHLDLSNLALPWPCSRARAMALARLIRTGATNRAELRALVMRNCPSAAMLPLPNMNSP
jgi:hypothetical protein